MLPLILSSVLGEYLFVWMCVRPGHDAYFLDLMAASHVYLTGKPASVWRYLMSAATLGMP